MVKQSLLLCSMAIASVSAYTSYVATNGFGTPLDAAVVAASQNPNITKTVPLQMGNQNFTVRVKVAEFIPTNASTEVTDPRVAASFYDLQWTDGSSLNSTIRAAESLTDSQSPRLCVAIPFGVFPVSVTNGYKDSDNGDCSGALGDECVKALKNTYYSFGVSCTPTLPDVCKSKLSSDGTGSTSLISRNSTQNTTSPVGLGWYQSAVYPAGNTTFYEREAERLHVIVLSGTQTYPVCVRVKTDRVKQSDAATSDGVRRFVPGMAISMLMAMGIAFGVS